MTSLSSFFSFLSVACLGLFAGAMLTEGAVLVPYWRALPAGEFFTWYRGNATRLVGFFGPVTWAAGLSALVAGGVSAATGQPGGGAAVVAAALMLAAVATFFVYFDRANASFAAARLAPDDLEAELARWSRWHWLRTALGVAALTAGLLALRR
jgi:Domain of unknown function (DUF1772)